MFSISRAAAATLLCLSVAAIAVAEVAPAAQSAREVLPDTVIPTHYDLLLSPDAEALTYRGKVAISIDVRAATTDVLVNSVGLTFEHAKVDGGPDGTVSFQEKTGRAAVHFAVPVAKGQHVLSIDYTGKIAKSTLGFFAMDYMSPAGPRRTLATNFEPAHARELLPCWDEPARKATFTVSIDAPQDRLAISNMPVADITPLAGTLQRVRFAETPKMSTYLLFVGVGDFERIHQSVDGVDVGIVVKRGDTPNAAYALEQAVKLLHYYNEYFGVRFPLPKLDLIAAPGEIEGGSMENWGAIFYSQNHVLFDPAKSTEADRQLVFLVVAHEMAHQWFGDLVTMAWWDNLWLNEGFARWMQTFVADDLHPEWETGLQAVSIFEQGKQADAAPSTHPVVQEIQTADQAEEAFDYITYDKGAAIITMMNAYVGRDHFRDGVRRYMHAHAFGNTVDSDLWTVMQQVAGKPILAIERDFTRQPGVPLVRVARTGKGAHLLEGRFAQDPATIKNEPPQTWRLPLAIRPLDGGDQTILLGGATDVAFKLPALVNAGQLGYARVLYDNDTFDALAPRLGTLGPIDQLGLLNDSFALGTAGYAPVSRLVSIPAGLPAAANPIVWSRVLVLLTQIDTHYADTPQRAAFRSFALRLLAPLAARIGPDAAPGESANITILRASMSVAQATFGDAAVLDRARKSFASDAGTPAERRTAMSIVAAHADAGTFDALLERAQKDTDPLQKQHMFEALAGVTDPVLARRMAQIAMTDQIPAGGSPDIIYALAVEHSDLVWQLVVPRLNDAALRIDKSDRWRIVAAVAAHSIDPQRIVDLQDYVAKNVPAEASRPFLAAAASIRQNQVYASKVLPEIDSWIIRSHRLAQGGAPGRAHLEPGDLY
jgi:aminopeptidase N